MSLFPEDRPRCPEHGEPLPCFQCAKPDTLRAAREALFGAVFESGKGVDCPCCGRRVQRYKRHINSAMAATLIWTCREFFRTQDWVPVARDGPRLAIKNREYARLRHWGLIEAKPNADPKKRDSGFWKPTSAAYTYIRREARLPKTKYVFKNTVLGESEETADVVEALGKNFDYAELMDWTKP